MSYTIWKNISLISLSIMWTFLGKMLYQNWFVSQIFYHVFFSVTVAEVLGLFIDFVRFRKYRGAGSSSFGGGPDFGGGNWWKRESFRQSSCLNCSNKFPHISSTWSRFLFPVKMSYLLVSYHLVISGKSVF